MHVLIACRKKEHGRNHECGRREHEHRASCLCGSTVKVLTLALEATEEHGGTKHEQEITDDGAGDGSFCDFDEACMNGKDRNDEFGRIPEGSVQEAANSGIGAQCEVL